MFIQGRFNLQGHIWLIHCCISKYQTSCSIKGSICKTQNKCRCVFDCLFSSWHLIPYLHNSFLQSEINPITLMHRCYIWLLGRAKWQEKSFAVGNQVHDLQEQAWTQLLINLERKSPNKLYFQERPWCMWKIELWNLLGLGWVFFLLFFFSPTAVTTNVS